MKNSKASFQSMLGQVRGLGSAKDGTAHWWMLRLTSLALIPLSIYILGTFIYNAVFGEYDDVRFWMTSPLTDVFMILFLVTAFHHAANGVQEVIEDYVHCECAKLTILLVVRFFAVVFAGLGILAVLSIQFQGLIPHVKGV